MYIYLRFLDLFFTSVGFAPGVHPWDGLDLLFSSFLTRVSKIKGGDSDMSCGIDAGHGNERRCGRFLFCDDRFLDFSDFGVDMLLFSLESCLCFRFDGVSGVISVAICLGCFSGVRFGSSFGAFL